MDRVVILTGARRVGKSTVCSKAAALARRRGYVCGGILTVADQGVRHVLDLRTGQRRCLTVTSGREDVVAQGRFRFSRETLSWGNEALRRSVPCDLLVIDEVGPLEVERGQGWVAAFDVLGAGDYGLALLVVRPELLTQVGDILAVSSRQIVPVTERNRDDLPVSLAAMAADVAQTTGRQSVRSGSPSDPAPPVGPSGEAPRN